MTHPSAKKQLANIWQVVPNEMSGRHDQALEAEERVHERA